MGNNDSIVYDPLYRVVEDVGPFESIEGRYKRLFDILKSIDNLGVIPRVFEMARYPKYEHTIGVIHQVSKLLSMADKETIPDRYRQALKLSSIFVHIGHTPFTFTTERALLLAANMGNRGKKNDIEDYISEKVSRALSEIQLDKKDIDNRIKNVMEMREPKKLYRFFSSCGVLNRKRDLLDNNHIEEGRIKTVIENLIYKESDGYTYLNLASKADYVQRDALYLGTAKIDIPPENLYQGISKYDPKFGLSEERLIEVNLNYLSDRFYENKETVWFSRLLEKVISSISLSENFKSEYIEKYDDSDFERLITSNRDKNNEHANLPESWCERAHKILNDDFEFNQVFHIGGDSNYVPFNGDVVDFEYELINKRQSIRGLLKYPFENGTLISLEYAKDNNYNYEDQSFDVRLFKDKNSTKFEPISEIVSNVIPYVGFSGVSEIRKGISELLSKTGYVSFDNMYGLSMPVVRAISNEIEQMEESDVSGLLHSLPSYSTYSQIWTVWENRIWLNLPGTLLADPNNVKSEEARRDGLVTGLLSLPVDLLNYSKPSSFLETVRDRLYQSYPDVSNDEKGSVFEAYCLVDRILNNRDCFQLFVNGMYLVNPQLEKGKRRINEYDIIEITHSDTEGPKIYIYECTIRDDYQNKDREKLREISDYIRDNVFTDVTISANHMVESDSDDELVEIEDAGTFS